MHNLKEIISNRGLSIVKVGVNSKISDTTILSYINGSKIPSLPTLISMADYLSCNIDYLLDRTNNPMKVDDISNLDPEVSQLICNYLTLSKDNQRLVKGYIKGLIDSEK